MDDMEWTNILGPLVAIAIVILLRYVLGKKKKGGAAQTAAGREEFYEHLLAVGEEVSLTEENDRRAEIGLGRTSGQRSEGIIRVEDRHLDAINVVNMTSQFGTSYFLDYLVKTPNLMAGRTPKKTRLVVKKSPPIVGKMTGLQWSGDPAMAKTLSLDYSLEDKLLRAMVGGFSGNILIMPEVKEGYTRIRTDYYPPSADLLGGLKTIAKYVKAW